MRVLTNICVFFGLIIIEGNMHEDLIAINCCYVVVVSLILTALISLMSNNIGASICIFVFGVGFLSIGILRHICYNAEMRINRK